MQRSRWWCRRRLKVGSTAEFVALARAKPGQLNWAATTGLPLYIVAALQKSANIDITQISYRDFGPAFQDFATGRVHLLATGITSLLPQVNAGRGRFLFVPNRAALAARARRADRRGGRLSRAHVRRASTASTAGATCRPR